jgi:hypothetical protein
MKTENGTEGQPQVGSDAGLAVADCCQTCRRWQSFDFKTGECHDQSKVVWASGTDIKLILAPTTPANGCCDNWTANKD